MYFIIFQYATNKQAFHTRKWVKKMLKTIHIQKMSRTYRTIDKTDIHKDISFVILKRFIIPHSVAQVINNGPFLVGLETVAFQSFFEMWKKQTSFFQNTVQFRVKLDSDGLF